MKMANQEGFAARMKENRRLRAGEKKTFRSELRVIPGWLRSLVAGLYLIALAFVGYLVISRPGDVKMTPDLLVNQPMMLKLLVMFAIVTVVAFFLGGLVLLFGYVGGDAKRRGMMAWLWVLVAIFVPYLIGVILYFVVREPLPSECPQCGTTVAAQFNFCPSCKFNLRPNCPQCRLAIRPGDTYCPHCGLSLPQDAPAQAGANA